MSLIFYENFDDASLSSRARWVGTFLYYTAHEIHVKIGAKVRAAFGRYQFPEWTRAQTAFQDMGGPSRFLIVFFHGRNGAVPHTHYDIPRLVRAAIGASDEGWDLYAPTFKDYGMLGATPDLPEGVLGMCEQHLQYDTHKLLIMGISYGGVVAQQLLNALCSRSGQVAMVTYGAPHHGTELVRLHKGLAKWICGDAMFARLEPHTTRIASPSPRLSFASTGDVVVFPPDLCDVGMHPFPDLERHYTLQGVPHSAIPTHPLVLEKTRAFVEHFTQD